MFALVSPEKIQLPPGAVVRLLASWQQYQALIAQRGDRCIPRIKYRTGEVLLMAPLPRHGRNVDVLADIVKALLDHRERDYDSFTPVTMTLPEESGIEPDHCFYIDNWPAISGKGRIDWQVDPPPDLVLEIDVTTYTDINDYLPFQVPEVWLLEAEQLKIYCLQNSVYQQQFSSRYFPEVDLPSIVTNTLRIAYDRNTSAAIRQLRQTLSNA